MIDLQQLNDTMSELNGSEFKILFYLANGYSYARSIGKEYYEASYSQIMKYTGIAKRNSVASSIKKLTEMGLITQETQWVSGNCKSTSKFTCALYKEGSNQKLPDSTKKVTSSSNQKLPEGSNQRLLKVTKENKIKVNKEKKKDTYTEVNSLKPFETSLEAMSDSLFMERNGVSKFEHMLQYHDDAFEVITYFNENQLWDDSHIQIAQSHLEGNELTEFNNYVKNAKRSEVGTDWSKKIQKLKQALDGVPF